MIEEARCMIARSPLEEITEWVDRIPPTGRIFDKGLKVDLAASAIATEIVAFKIPAGMLGILRFMGNQVGSASDIPYVSFSVLLNGAPVVGYCNFIGPKSPGLSAPDALVVPLLSGSRISVVATNSLAMVIQNVAARIKGWFWVSSIQGRE